ncbi:MULTISPECIES: hypothetical protein [unclassified Microcoleus]|uniref:hypothetical protein n=1 Tax=unclassified Microcoleus TaxID=2642155 RepID=UPI002FCF6240
MAESFTATDEGRTEISQSWMQKLAEERAYGKKQHGIQKVNSEIWFLPLGLYLLLVGSENGRSTIRSFFRYGSKKKLLPLSRSLF